MRRRVAPHIFMRLSDRLPFGTPALAGRGNRMPFGLIGGAETLVANGVILLWPRQAALLFSVFAALVAVTVVPRLGWAGRNLS